MRIPNAFLAACSAVLFLAAGCGGEASRTEAAKSAIVQHTDRSSSIVPVADSSQKKVAYTGLWTQRLLNYRLIDRGMKVLSSDSVIAYQHLSVKGVNYHTGRGDVRAFFYPDTLAAQKDYAKLDTLTAAPPGVQANWPTGMTLVRSLNLIAILLFDSPNQAERVANGILGGLPPPIRDK